MKYFILALLIFVSFGVAAAQEPASDTTPVIDEIFLAKANLQGKAGEAAEKFLVTDVPIFCVVRLHSVGVASIRMDLIAAKVPGVELEKEVVSLSYTTKSNEDRVNFTARPSGSWVSGKYRVDIFIGGKKVRNIEFEIKAASTEAEKPPVLKRSPKPARRSPSGEKVARQTYGRAFR